MAKLYYPNGDVKEVTPKNGTDFKCEELHQLVEGYFEVVRLNHDYIMVVNEEGKLNNLSFNEKATGIFQAHIGGDFIAGNALVCKKDEML